MIFYCTMKNSDEGKKVNGQWWLYIEADRWFDARKAAQILFGTDRIVYKEIQGPIVEFQHLGNYFTAKWVGSPMHRDNQPELKVTAWPREEDLPPKNEEPSDGSSSSSSDSGASPHSSPTLTELPAETPSTSSVSEGKAPSRVKKGKLSRWDTAKVPSMLAGSLPPAPAKTRGSSK